VSTTRAKCAKL